MQNCIQQRHVRTEWNRLKMVSVSSGIITIYGGFYAIWYTTAPMKVVNLMSWWHMEAVNLVCFILSPLPPFHGFIGIFTSPRAEFRKVFFAVITPNSAHFAGNHSVALDMQDFEPLFTLYSTLQLCATLCRHFTCTLRTFCKKTPLKPFNCTILHNPAKC